MIKHKNMDGRPINFCLFNLALYGEMDPDMPAIRNSEFNKYIPSIKSNGGKPMGRIFLASTAGDMDNKSKMSDLWNDQPWNNKITDQ